MKQIESGCGEMASVTERGLFFVCLPPFSYLWTSLTDSICTSLNAQIPYPDVLMKILHTADLHLGQIIYQNYDRADEHQHFFQQLTRWCMEHQPDALLLSGDIFDIQQPSAATKKVFNDYFVSLHHACPEMRIVITAGNHDSASRLQADSTLWAVAGTTLVGTGPSVESEAGWEEKYIVRMEAGYIVALPYMVGERQEQLQHLLDRIAAENTEGKPVVMMGHTAVAGLDVKGHDFEIGKLKTQSIESFGKGFDYLALGHIHKPQTIGYPEDVFQKKMVYPAPVVRYSGSALHVSCDETYPHSVSLVTIEKHGGEVTIVPLRIDELRHFYVLPQEGAFTSEEEALEAVRNFVMEGKKGYIRLSMDYTTHLPSDFNQKIYDFLRATLEEVRYNPKIVWTDRPEEIGALTNQPTFAVADLQQMTDPMVFIEKTIDNYPQLALEEIRSAFEEVKLEMARMDEEVAAKGNRKTKKDQPSIDEIIEL